VEHQKYVVWQLRCMVAGGEGDVKRRWRKAEDRLETVVTVLIVAYLIAIAAAFIWMYFGR
jgi:hypothetical protein